MAAADFEVRHRIAISKPVSTPGKAALGNAGYAGSAVRNVDELTSEESDKGALRVPQDQRNGSLACSFSYLACSFTSDDMREWDEHCQSHFRGTLPMSITCPFTCDWTKTTSSGRDSWHARAIHIATEHRNDCVDTSKRPNGVLLEHLWRTGVIDNTQLKELRMHGRLRAQVLTPFDAVVHNARRSRRRVPSGNVQTPASGSASIQDAQDLGPSDTPQSSNVSSVHQDDILKRSDADPTPAKRESAASETSKRKGSDTGAGLHFVTINHPDELKNKDQMREIRRHVMHTYLDKEAQGTGSEQAASKSLPEQMLPRLRKLEEKSVEEHSSAKYDGTKAEPGSRQQSIDPAIGPGLGHDGEDEHDSEIGFSRAGAYAARLAALRRQPVQRQIQDQNWHKEDNAGFQGLLAHQYRFNAGPDLSRTLKPPSSRSSSLTVTLPSRSSTIGKKRDQKAIGNGAGTVPEIAEPQHEGSPSLQACVVGADFELPRVSHRTPTPYIRAMFSQCLRYLRPRIPKGCQRLEWTCSCGKAMHGDYVQDEVTSTSTLFRNLPECRVIPTSTWQWPPEILQLPLYSKISNISQAARTRAANDQTESTTMTTSTPARSAAHGPFQPTSSSFAQFGNEHMNRPEPKVGCPLRVYGPLSSSERRPCFLELCVNRNRSQVSLGEIQVCTAKGEQLVTGDQQLFREIRRRYNSLRRRGLYKFLYRPFDVHFVRFGVQRGGYQTGIYQSPLAIPPQVEVTEGRYHYYECPLDPLPPIDSRTFFHYFWDHESHPECSGHPGFDSLFYNRLPKKLGTSMLLQTDPDKLHLGWGIHIVEGPNKPLLAWLATAILVLSFLFSLLYDIGMKNKDSGFAIGQWMVATLATTLMAVYFHLGDMA